MKLFFLLIVISFPVTAQQSGWGALGEMFGGGEKQRQEEIYRDRYIENIEAQNALANAERLRRENDILEVEISLKYQLVNAWTALGLNETEAKEIAHTYKFTDEQFAHVSRAKREGRKLTVDAAIQAYQLRQYQLANQLLIAATRDGVPEP